MAWIEVYGGQRSLAFELSTAITFINHCYLAGNFPTAYALIGYFEVTWHLTMKLFRAKIYDHCKIYDVRE